MKLRFLWVIEFLIWAALIALVSFAVQYFHSVYVKNTSTAYVFFKDTDGLIIGSPVKYMGVQVGYVSDLKILDNEAFVTFRITDRHVKIPQGTIASIEFAGLAASKSLELYPPTLETIKTGHFIKVIEPIRLQTFFDRQNNIAMNIIDITNEINFVVTRNNINQIQHLLRSRQLFENVYRGLNEFDELEGKTMKIINERAEKRNNVSGKQ